MNLTRRWLASIAALLLAGLAGGSLADGRDDHRRHGSWFTAWGGPQQDSAAPLSFVAGTTLRETVWLTLGGNEVRVKFANTFGAAPLFIGAASVGLKAPAAGAVTPGSLHAITFGGKTSVTVPIQGFVLSDPVELRVPALTDVSVSIFLPQAQIQTAQYPGSRKVTYVAAGAGDQTQALALPFTTTLANGSFMSSVEVKSRHAGGVIAVIGDSIVAGTGSTAENLKWTDRLAARIHSARHQEPMSVLGLGFGGNRVLSGATTNPSALTRFDRDVLGMAGLTHVILADGVNDLGSTATLPDPATQPPLADDVAYGVRQLVERARARGIKVIGTTMGPAGNFRGYNFTEPKRIAYNAWMRSEGVKILDGLIDFDTILRNPADPANILPLYSIVAATGAIGDGIHPNDAGHQAMADGVDLRFFSEDHDRDRD